jgi:predicted unusual protein kinase regulating ubiquinone biosynthesis (AarF/ABC1/UbiB family)
MRDDPTLDDLGRGFRKRTLATARLATRPGLKAVRRTLGGARQREADPEQAVKVATELVQKLDGLKGLVMKLGQIASYAPGAMPPEAQRVLAKLQAHATALPFARVDQMLRDELGGGADELFESFERAPLAAASIGQVHRARLAGRDVAVKVQYPGIEDVLASDLDTLGLLARMSTFGAAVDGKSLVAELRARTLEECDYLHEAANQRLFRQLLAHDPYCHVPEVIGERTSRRVLTSELVRGENFYAFADAAPEEARHRAAQAIFRTCFDTIFRRCVYNGDPHPGNYLFHEGGRVTFLDFGCVRHFEPAMIDRWKAVALAVVEGDRPAFERLYPELGLVPNPKKFDWEHQWRVMRYLYKPYTEPAPYFTYTDEYVRESYALMLFDNPNARRTAMPPEWLLLNRLQWGINSVLAHLGARGPWPEIWREAIESATAPAAETTPLKGSSRELVETAVCAEPA